MGDCRCAGAAGWILRGMGPVVKQSWTRLCPCRAPPLCQRPVDFGAQPSAHWSLSGHLGARHRHREECNARSQAPVAPGSQSSATFTADCAYDFGKAGTLCERKLRVMKHLL